jgi:general L-amino acid transport system permease protein
VSDVDTGDTTQARPAGDQPADRARVGSLVRDQRVLRVLFQAGVLAVVGGLLFWLNDNLRVNLHNQGLDLSFDFLEQPASFPIAHSSFSPANDVWHALLTGLRNTLVVAVVGMLMTLVLGTLIGIGRLSGNWLVRKVAGTYVETFRNLPPLLVVLFVNTLLLATLPNSLEDATDVGGVLLLSVRGVGMATLRGEDDAGTFLAVLAILALAAAGVWILRGVRERRTGTPARGARWALLPALALAVLAFVALGQPFEVSHPEATGPSQISGGAAMTLPYVAVLVGLVLYTASHVAEIVRGSILAVPRGQNEAATAVGLTGPQRLRYVVLPQAFRVAVPPLINQGLNLTKNSSLGVAVGYAEVMYVAETAIGNGSPAIQTFLVVMAMYLVVSLAISAVGNVANRRLRLVER